MTRPGDRVEYRPHGGPVERGTVKRIGARYVYVTFDGDQEAKAVSPEDLAAEEANRD